MSHQFQQWFRLFASLQVASNCQNTPSDGEFNRIQQGLENVSMSILGLNLYKL